MEVHAFELDVGTIFSQHQGVPCGLYPLTFYSYKRSLNDLGSCELLSVKLALKSGGTSYRMVLKDHKKLKYFRKAKKLNLQQAYWVGWVLHQIQFDSNIPPRNEERQGRHCFLLI